MRGRYSLSRVVDTLCHARAVDTLCHARAGRYCLQTSLMIERSVSTPALNPSRNGTSSSSSSNPFANHFVKKKRKSKSEIGAASRSHKMTKYFGASFIRWFAIHYAPHTSLRFLNIHRVRDSDLFFGHMSDAHLLFSTREEKWSGESMKLSQNERTARKCRYLTTSQQLTLFLP